MSKITILLAICYFCLAKADLTDTKELSREKCQNVLYARSQVSRFCVPENLTSWSTQYPEYQPPFYEATSLMGKPWADPLIGDTSFKPNFNEIDGRLNRASYTGRYKIANHYPLNPSGRTGIVGRGFLGRWGPNHAADSLLTRWSRDANKTAIIDPLSRSQILQMIAIRRRDNNMWAIPGGMVEEGEAPFNTAKREFCEEAMHNAPDEDISLITRFFDDNFKEISALYVDDYRNTDNAWIETTAFNAHDETGKVVANLHFKAGDDANDVMWMDVNENIELHPAHRKIVKKIVDLLKAHW